MITVNEYLSDEAISHAVDLQQYSNQTVRRILAVLNRSEARISDELAVLLNRIDITSFQADRLQSLLYSVYQINKEAYSQAGQELTAELREFVKYEAQYYSQLLSFFPAQVSVASISAEVVYTAALSRPFQGLLLNGVLDDLEATKAKRIRQVIAQGFTESKTTAQIIKELRGTKANKYADGLFQADRRSVEAITRTALGHMAGFTQDRFVEANEDLIKAVVWSATLDTRTSEICRPRDKKLYTPVTHKPIGHSLPWLGGPSRAHFNCRSHQTTVLKTNKELGIDLPEIVLPNRQRASMDGGVPESQSYNEWLSKQSIARQTEVLGAKRVKLLREGKLPMDQLYDSKGQFLTLNELKIRNARVFAKAGV